MPLKSVILITALTVILIIGGVWIGQNVNLLPLDASVNAPIYDELFKVLFSIGTILFIGILGLVLFSLIKFRKKPGEEGDGIALEGNISLEIFWTAIPAIVILFVGIYSYDIYDRMGGMQTLHSSQHSHENMSPNKKVWGGIGSSSTSSNNKNFVDPLNIEVTAQQFAFLFHYPKGDILSGELHVPSGQTISLTMESKDVIHAFWVPEFRLKQDIIPGQPTLLNFTPTKEGRYPIICAELCGPYHGGMRSTVVVENPDNYLDWFNKNSKEIISTSEA